MNTITVNASQSYEVRIGAGLLAQIGQHIASVSHAETAVIISDSNVFPLYGQSAKSGLLEAGFRVLEFVFPAGEASKNANTYLQVLNFLAENKVTRSDVLIALGGGVVGDLTGFVAATYLRGISYVQVPTSLLAMVDSSVGGKTAIDLPAGKNLVGAFCQPALVLCDTNTLHTLPDHFFRDGSAEVIKYGVLFDADLFARLRAEGLDFDRETVISRCVELKRDVVCADEFDTGLRQKLNLGHTIGHGIEAESNFTVSHGRAVAMGMAIAAKCAVKAGLCDAKTEEEILDVLAVFGLPTFTNVSAGDIYRRALSDKKRSGNTINLILPQRIGDCVIYPIHKDALLKFMEAGM